MANYKTRAHTEYIELVDRVNKLEKMLEANKKGELDFTLNCPVWLLENQLKAMHEYLACLMARDSIEHFLAEE